MPRRYYTIFTSMFSKVVIRRVSTHVFSYSKILSSGHFYSAMLITPLVLSHARKPVLCSIYNDQKMCDRLCFSCRKGNLKEVNILLNNGCEINCKHSLGWSPIHTAVACQNIALLIENGADVNAADEFPGLTKIAARRRIVPYDAAQIRSRDFGDGFNLTTDFTGFTPLHYAVLDDSEIGADITIKNVHGDTPCDLALTEEIKNFLIPEYEKALEIKRNKEREERRKYPLENRLKEFIVGQEEAINTVAQTIRRKESGWTRGDKPLVLLFLGSSGVGKTELAKQLANYLFKDKRHFIRVDMSEYQEKHEVSKFIGAPPGYVGYDQGGQLTGNLKECPDAVVLFDEIEKAHPDIITIMLQLFDEGRLTDGQGKTIECPNAIFIMTSNLASEEIAKYATKLRLQQSSDVHEPGKSSEDVKVSKQFKDKVMYPILKSHFRRDEFLGRINDMIYFLPFTKSELYKLVEIELKFWAKQAMDKHKINLTWDPDLLSVLSDGYDIHYGARSLKHEVEKKIVNKVADLHEEGKAEKNANVHISVNYGPDDSPLESPELVFTVKNKSWFGF